MLSLDAPLAYFLARAIDSTAAAGEPPAEAADRREAIEALFRALDPRDTVEASLAAGTIELDFLAHGAFRAVNHPEATPDKQQRLRGNALAASRSLSRSHDEYRTLRARPRVARAKAATEDGRAPPRDVAAANPGAGTACDRMAPARQSAAAPSSPEADAVPGPMLSRQHAAVAQASPAAGSPRGATQASPESVAGRGATQAWPPLATAHAKPPAAFAAPEPPAGPPMASPDGPPQENGFRATQVPTLTWRPPLGGEDTAPKTRFKDRLKAETAYRDPPGLLKRIG